MTETIPQYAIDEITCYIAMPNASLLKSYELYLHGDWHQYSNIVLAEIKKEIDKRGLTI